MVEKTTPNHALQTAAGEFAGALALIWPRPHAPYFAADPARRRLAAIIVSRVQGPRCPQALAGWSLRRLIEHYLPSAPAGLAEALRKLEIDPLTSADIERIFTLLAAKAPDESGKILRHASRIDRRLLDVLAGLPPALRRPRIAALLEDRVDAELVRRGVEAWRGRPGEDARKLAALAERLERAASGEGLFQKLLEALDLESLRAPPVPGADWLQPIVGVRALRRAALRFRNCLAMRVPLVLEGTAAYYEVVGHEPAVVEILLTANRRRWCVGEVRGHANRDVSPALGERIDKHLALHGATRRDAGRRAGGGDLVIDLARAAGLFG